jgi:uncharacterized membrane protein
VNAGPERAIVNGLAAVFTITAVVWIVLLVSAPVALATDGARLLALGVYEIGSRVCHQLPERSFHVAGIPMPVCARCAGLYASGAAGVAFAWISRRGVWSVARPLLIAAALPIAVTVALEWLHLIATTNAVRFVTGLPLGFAAGWIVIDALVRAPAMALAPRG